MINELGTKRFKIEEVVDGVSPNITKKLNLTISQYDPISFDPKYLDELIYLLTTFKELREKDAQKVAEEWTV
ncbi:hypothetical protein [Gorillibacterium sp. sgz5001074]|uniref:hypothetical protein n=1 Tax=Gorillibacterium sp. sgz5001074 TaxID=3446695 RepID=UPI003F666E8C